MTSVSSVPSSVRIRQEQSTRTQKHGSRNTRRLFNLSTKMAKIGSSFPYLPSSILRAMTMRGE